MNRSLAGGRGFIHVSGLLRDGGPNTSSTSMNAVTTTAISLYPKRRRLFISGARSNRDRNTTVPPTRTILFSEIDAAEAVCVSGGGGWAGDTNYTMRLLLTRIHACAAAPSPTTFRPVPSHSGDVVVGSPRRRREYKPPAKIIVAFRHLRLFPQRFDGQGIWPVKKISHQQSPTVLLWKTTGKLGITWSKLWKVDPE